MVEILMALIKAEIFQKPFEQDKVQLITSEAMRNLYMLAIRHDLAHIVGAALQKQGFLGNDEISQKFMHAIYLAVARTENMQHERNQIYELFEKEQILFVPLKGAVICEYYPEIWQRTSCDIDILVKQEQLEKAKECLVQQLGYHVHNYNFHDVSLYSPSGVHLELHFSILEHKDNIDQLLGKVWDYVSPAKESSSQCVMEPEYFMFHVLAHMLHHFLNGGCGIRPFVDLRLLKLSGEFSKEKMDEFCQICEIQGFVEYVWRLSEIWFSDGKHDEVSMIMQSYILNGGTYGTKKNLMTVTKTKTKGRIRYILKRLFMSKNALSINFPRLKKMPYLYPYYTMKRWGTIFKSKKMHGIAQEIDLYNVIERDRVGEIKQLFRNLGL